MKKIFNMNNVNKMDECYIKLVNEAILESQEDGERSFYEDYQVKIPKLPIVKVKKLLQDILDLVPRRDFHSDLIDRLNIEWEMNVICYDDNSVWINWELLNNSPERYHILWLNLIECSSCRQNLPSFFDLM